MFWFPLRVLKIDQTENYLWGLLKRGLASMIPLVGWVKVCRAPVLAEATFPLRAAHLQRLLCCSPVKCFHSHNVRRARPKQAPNVVPEENRCDDDDVINIVPCIIE